MRRWLELQRARDKHRRGGEAVQFGRDEATGEVAVREMNVRFPEVMGLRYCPVRRMYLNHDDDAATNIMRIRVSQRQGRSLPPIFRQSTTIEEPADD